MYKACSRCGKIHPFNYTCTKGKERRFTATAESKLRSLSAWQTKRASIKERAFNLCEVCKSEGVYTYDGLEIHHITPLKENPNGLLEDSNLICLCVKHHKQADEGLLKPSYLRGLASDRDGANDSDNSDN